MKPPSPLLGFNNNVRHKGRVFHIQTEDSGVRHPHIITHLFADGGRILKTAKTSYAEFIDAPNMGEVVRQMMQDQHKAMFMALRDGQFDHLVEELPPRGGVSSATRAPAVTAKLAVPAAIEDAPTVELAPTPPAPPLPLPPAPPPPRVAAPTAPAIPAALHRPAPLFQQPPPIAAAVVDAPPPSVIVPPPPPSITVTATDRPSPPQLSDPALRPTQRPTPTRVARPRLDIDPAAIHRTPTLRPTPSGGTLASIVETTEDAPPGIDLDTLERAAAEAETPFFQQIHDLPPPPAAVLGARGPTGGYSSITAATPPQPPPPSTRGRYAPSRPSSIFANVRPQEGSSIFGEDLISEKSLDEVILSYLAEDLDGPGEKK